MKWQLIWGDRRECKDCKSLNIERERCIRYDINRGIGDKQKIVNDKPCHFIQRDKDTKDIMRMIKLIKCQAAKRKKGLKKFINKLRDALDELEGDI